VSGQTFHTIDACRLEVAVKPSTPYNLVANPSGALGAWGWVTPGTSYMRRAPGENHLEHLSSVGSATVFYTEPMPVTAGHYAAAAIVVPTTPTSSFTWQIEWLNAAQASAGLAAASGAITTTGVHSRPAVLAPAGAAFFRLRFTQAAAGSVRVTSVRAVTATTAAALSGTVVRNVVPNPSFEVDASLWTAGTATTMVRTTTVAAVGAASLHVYRNVPNPGGPGASTIATVTGGLDYTLQARFRAQVSGGAGVISIAWLDGSGVQIGATVSATGPTSSTTAFGAPVTLTATAPSAAVQARVSVAHGVPGPGNTQGAYVDGVALIEGGASTTTYFDGSTAAGGTLSYAWEGTAHASASKQTDTNLTTLAETEWRNILGPTHRISTVRESLNLGTLEAELLDAALDPATSATLRPGGDVRVLALASGAWEPIFVGEIDRLLVTYDDKRRPTRPPRVSMTGLDRTVRLTNAKRTQGVAAVADLPFIVEGAGVPWHIDGSTAQLPTTPGTVSVNDNASALDQIALTRDSTGSHAWVDRKGVLVATTATGASVRTLDEPRYSDLEVAFSSEECINSVEIESLYVVEDFTPTGGVYGRSEVIPYGPYEDAPSIAQWGRRSRKFRVHGLTAAQVDAHAASILTRNANPGVSVQSVALPMRTTADLADAVRDLGEIVTVSNTARGIAPVLRVNRVAHTIESAPQKWMVRLGFARSTSVASPTIAPEVQTGRRGFEDTPWAAPAYSGSWVAYGAPSLRDARYCRRNGLTIIEGACRSGAIGSTIMTLPPGFRPTNRLIFVCSCGDPITAGRVDVWPDGTVVHNGGPSGTYPTGYVALAISFVAEQ
jgi:hypothetical protein